MSVFHHFIFVKIRYFAQEEEFKDNIIKNRHSASDLNVNEPQYVVYFAKQMKSSLTKTWYLH